MKPWLSSIPALVTPFRSDGEIDYRTFSDLIEWQISQGSDGILVHGSTGEAPTISPDEFHFLVKKAKDVIKGRVPLLVGTGTNATKSTVEKTLYAKELGADIALVVVPYYNIPTDLGCFLHFQKVANDGALPMIIYYHPGRTGKKIGIDTLVSFLSIPNVIGIKDSSSPETIQKILEKAPEAKLYSGNDESIIPSLRLGIAGSISVFANAFPLLWKRILMTDLSEAEFIYSSLEKIIEVGFSETNPIGIKALMEMLGKCSSDVRLPLTPMSNENRAILSDLLVSLKSL